MPTDDTRWLDATAQAELIAAREATSTELVDAAIERIERLDGEINAVVMRWFERARHQAAAFDELPIADEHRATPFAGVPFLLKDLHIHAAGMPLTSGNQAARADPPLSTHDSNLVERFRDAGLIALGRTNSPEFGSLPVTEPVAYGPTRNPWDTGHTPGGSSGGAAAAVAAGMVSIAHASDGGGSIRIPASCCGLVGLKPSQGRVSMGPERDESGLSTQLCVSRTVRDTARMLDAVHRPGVGDSVIAPAPDRPYVDELTADPGRLRIGLLDRHPLGGDLHADCVTAVRSAASLLEGLGHDVAPGHPRVLEDAEFPRRFAAMWAALMAVGIDALGQTLGRPLTADDVEPVNWAQGQYAANHSAAQYAMSLAAVGQYRRHLQGWWADGWDLLLTPTLSAPPLPIGALYGDQGDGVDPDNPMAPSIRAGRFVSFTPQFNASGQPAISLPLHWNDDGLPIGVQLVAAYGREDVLIRVAAQLEAAAPWADRHPPRGAATGIVLPVSRPNPDVDAVIFDFAGVLSSSPGEAMAAGMKEFDVDVLTFMNIVMGPLHEDGNHPWHQLERGAITMDQYLAAIEELWRAEGFESFPTPPRGHDVMATLRPIPEMIDAARSVRAAGYRTAILTNNVREWGSWRSAWDADNLVDVVIDSSEVGMRKPNADIFDLTIERLGSVAERTLFLDDFPWNIAGAETFGLQTMHVTDPVTAAAELLDRLL